LSIDEDIVAMTGFYPERFDLWNEVYKDHFIDGNMAFGTAAAHYG
jgi:hypothetical protein